ncbi:DUF2267 domain-containing protein [Rhodobacter maris]|uniref:DUF2267 domain-containing protein n=1 Tax=Rhodobacter maris TaxID=446682 RepID=A0A285RKK2_9RHOB|nr:DUF2267 domain-containing protein [Rhodobacter maris]SOB94394.1 uncharacterized protein SAMN05877831_101428 [Rhodobacter maris]
MPWTYRHAQKEFQAFLLDARERMGLVSDNMAFTAVEGVLRAFRACLTPPEALAFADCLPVVLRGLFLAHWDLAAAPLPFGTRAEMTQRAQALRPHHNLTPDNAIEATAFALWRYVDHAAFARVLAALGPEATAFWKPEVADPAEIAPRIF